MMRRENNNMLLREVFFKQKASEQNKLPKRVQCYIILITLNAKVFVFFLFSLTHKRVVVPFEILRSHHALQSLA